MKKYLSMKRYLSVAVFLLISIMASAQEGGLESKINKLQISKSGLQDVINLFGEAKLFSFSHAVVTRENLPERYAAQYEGVLFVFTKDVLQSIEVRTPDFDCEGIHVGSNMAEVFAKVGKPAAVVSGRPQGEPESGTFYEKSGGQAGVYQRRDLGVTFFFEGGKLAALNLYARRGGKLTNLPHYDSNKQDSFQVDLRGADVSGLDLRGRESDLRQAIFDTRTVWPGASQMPAGFNPQTILEVGKNPGLGVRSLHKRGITGKGVAIALVDNPLFEAHQEYASRIRQHEYVNASKDGEPHFHGSAVVSLAAGQTLGVAPGADVYFISSWAFGDGQQDLRPRAQAFERILEINKTLPKEKQVRVISMSQGWMPNTRGAAEMTAAANRAKEAGILVITSNIEQTHGFKFHGLGREPMADPDRFESYGPGQFWATEYDWRPPTDRLLVPMDSRTVAGTRAGEYIFFSQGGWSWSMPYIAGVYAMAVQVDPSITPDRFWALAMKTGRTVAIQREGRSSTLGPIIDPVALIAALEKR